MENTVIENLTTFPTAVLSFLFCLGFIMMIISMLSGMDIDFDFDTDLELDGDNGAGSIGKVMVISGLSKIPLMIGLTVTFFFATLICYFAQFILLSFLDKPESLFGYVIGTALMFSSFFISLFIAGFVLKPIEKIFDQDVSRATFDFINKACIVTSPSVNETNGEASVKGVHGDYLINVFSDESLVKGDKAIIVKKEKLNDDYDKYFIKKLS
jgi:hypothetical protein